MIKFIASDMDGTLLNERDEIHPEFYNVFEMLKEKGIIFSAASGRQYYNLVKRFNDVKDDIMFIAENGTFVVYKGKEILINALDKNIVNELIEIGRKIDGAYVVVCGKKAAYIESQDERLMKEVEKYYESREVVKDLKAVDDEILKVTMCDFRGSEENSNKYFEAYRDKLQVTVSGEIWLDITAKGANKGVAIRKVQELLDINPKETMVFGDYLNDLEMMKNAYHSYAMENAHPDLKKVARFVAKSNNDNGVLEKIKEVIAV